jgi:uncharacterized repeat protein (TIGR01451 family)
MPNLLVAILTALAALGFLSIKTAAAQQLLPNSAQLDQGISVSYPSGWSIGQPTLHSWVLLNVPSNQLESVVPTSQVAIGYLIRVSPADAVSQLTQYANESSVAPTFLTIGGWPALQRVQLVARHQPGEGERNPFPDPQTVNITTAVAAGNLLVRLEGSLPSDANQQLQSLVLAIGQSLTFSSTGATTQVQGELKKLQNSTSPATSTGGTGAPAQASALTGGAKSQALIAFADPPIFPLQQLNNGPNGELEVAVSNDGANIVIGKQSTWITSNDGGQTFPFTGSLTVDDGDSSISFAQSGNFYHAALACFGAGCDPPCPGASPSGTPPSTNNCMEVAPSTTKGQTFGALVNAAVCPNSGGAACSLDQEHIAADRINAGTGGSDLVYAAIRNCQGNCGTNGAFVTCSPDSDTTWAPLLALEAGSDYPRVAVGGDGSFYVVYEIGGNLRLDKFNACTTSASAITRASASFPVTVSGYSSFAGCEVAGGFGGLDRCNDGNTLSGPTVTVDDTNANHVYVAWANNTAANNEQIQVVDSTTGGLSWRTPVTVNSSATGRRYHPWVCATDGNAFVSWYDRRAATAANNDLTDYYSASAGLSSGNLVANNNEVKISVASDAQCKLWPRGVRSVFDSENCSVQPEDAGYCKLGPPLPTPDTSSNQRCDFVTTVCPFNSAGTETCQQGNFGQAVKYGDYNGNACIRGRLYTVFASSAGQSTVGDFFQASVVGSTTTATAYTGATSGFFHETVVLSAVLTLSGTSAGIGSQPIVFSVGTQSCTGVTNTTGAAACPLTINQTPGLYTVSASFAGSGNYQASSASTGFVIVAPPVLAKSFAGPTVPLNHTTTLTFTITNPNPTVSLTGVSFTDTLPAGLTAISAAGACGGTVSVLAGSITLTGGVIPKGSSCTIQATIEGTVAGVDNNVTSAVSSVNGGAGNTASATITVVAPPAISKTFGTIIALPVGGTTPLTFTITNPNKTVALTGVGFTDNLPGMVVSTPNLLTGSCGGGTITAVPGSGIISLVNATLAVSSSCTFSVSVTGVAEGTQDNITSNVTSVEGGTGNAASAVIIIGTVFEVSYASNLSIGDSTVNLTNAGTQGAENICVNVYAFDASEEPVACCSCLITPDGIDTLSVVKNVLTTVVPPSAFIELLASTPVAGTCDAASPTATNLALGMRSWGTHLQSNGQITETTFSAATLNATELTTLTTDCQAVELLLGGKRQCGSCP